MPLPVSEVERELTHTRRFRFEGYKRGDGLWDIEAHITDHKNHDHVLMSGVRRAGQAVHDMSVRITIDAEFNIRDAIAISDAVPYPGYCEHYGDVYRRLVGLNLLKAFRKRVHELLGGVKACTHITEMLGSLPTAAIQTFAGETREREDENTRPWHLDLCHAMDTRADGVRRYYPRWFRGAGGDGKTGEKAG